MAGLKFDSVIPEFGKSVAEIVLEPTRIYVKSTRKLLEKFGANMGIRGIAHITGGGLHENLSRILPEGIKLRIERSWTVPPVFSWLQKLGNVDADEMDRVFNMGIGLVLVARADLADAILEASEFPAWKIGRACGE